MLKIPTAHYDMFALNGYLLLIVFFETKYKLKFTMFYFRMYMLKFSTNDIFYG